jgi:uncharacterized protein (TIGR02246 family)
MVASGISPRDVLLTATRGGAAMMGRESDLGTLAPGKLADVVLLKEDPLKDIRAIDTVQHVIKDGRAFTADAVLKESPAQVVQRQVNAYNARDAAILARTYAPNAAVLHNGSPVVRGRAAIAELYGKLFKDNPQLHVEITSREVHGNTVTDRERATGRASGETLEATVTYEVANGLIARAALSS